MAPPLSYICADKEIDKQQLSIPAITNAFWSVDVCPIRFQTLAVSWWMKTGPSKPADFQQKVGYQYYDMRREYYQSKDHQADVCLSAPCESECCKSQPRLNSGQCTELCNNPKLKFNCTCTEGFTGNIVNRANWLWKLEKVFKRSVQCCFVLGWTNRDRAHCFVQCVSPNVFTG